MHILVTNDDGPPSPTSSPYVHSLIRTLQAAGHTVSVCLPHVQRSWIGKAHLIGKTVKPYYYRPSKTFDPRPTAVDSGKAQGTTHTRPSNSKEVEEWILVDGTPASCAQIGLYHFFQEKGPVDLVIAGPNYGRNTTAVFALSSGTLGGAMEAAMCRKKAIALSYAFSSRNHDPAIIDAASKHSLRIIEKLYAEWPDDGVVDYYTVNVPLVENVAKRKILYAPVLQNYWGDSGACFQEVEGSIGDEEEEETRIREGEGGNGADGEDERIEPTHRHFKWAPQFQDVYKSVDEAPAGNDGWAVKEDYTSITPLKANFWHAETHLLGKEMVLDPVASQITAPTTNSSLCKSSLQHRPKDHFYALISYEDPYVQPLILSALSKLFQEGTYTILSPPSSTDEQQSEIPLQDLLPTDSSKILQITSYESIDWSFVSSHPTTCLVNSYMLRKALIRKHYLSATVENWVAKRPGSVLKDHVKRSEHFELDYAEFLDDALVEAFELRASLERNEEMERDGREAEKEWWILKPGMSDRGQGIRLFSSMEELQGIFEGWEEDSDQDEEEHDDSNLMDGTEADGHHDRDEASSHGGDYGITTSQLRHFVAQPYIHPPLLLPAYNDRKFHIRTYVLCVGSLDVYVYRDMLALFAGKRYVAPCESSEDLEAHLTNTCFQRTVKDGSVQRFWDIDLSSTSSSSSSSSPEVTKESIFAQICAATGDVFEAAARGMMMHFQPLPNAFEVYGLDFLVDAQGTAWLLEVNAFPDFKQTGEELRGLVQGLWDGAIEKAVGSFFGMITEGGSDDDEVREGGQRHAKDGETDKMVLVKRVELGRRW